MIDPLDTAPESSISIAAILVACALPRSSAWMIKRFSCALAKHAATVSKVVSKNKRRLICPALYNVYVPVKSAPAPVSSLTKRKRIAFGWYGGKFSHLEWLLPLLPPCHHYCEPF